MKRDKKYYQLRRNSGIIIPTPVALGSIHSDNFDSTSLAAYSQTGTAMSAATGDLVINTSAGSHNEYLILNTPNIVSAMGQHCLEKWEMRALFTCPATGAFGFGLGVRSNNGPEQFDNTVRIAFDTAQEANRGTLYIYNSQNHGAPGQTVVLIGSQLLNPGTDYVFGVTRFKNTLFAKVYASDGTTVVKDYGTIFTYNITSVNAVRSHNAGRFCLWAYGATNLPIKNYSIQTTALKFADILGLGDSNMYGLYAAANSRRYLEQVATNMAKQLEIMAGINCEIPDIPLAAAIALAPRMMYINIGSNDKANGVSDATRRTRYASMVSTLLAAGYGITKVVLGDPIARNGIDIALCVSDTATNQTAYLRPATYAATKNPGDINLQPAFTLDNIHLTPAGEDACVSVTQTAIDALI